MIPYGKQTLDDDDIAAVVAVLRSDFLTQGPAVAEFESALCDITEARYAVAMSSGTAALHASLAVAGIGPGATVAVPALTFAASSNAARYVGADVHLVDIDPSTLNIDVGLVPPTADALVAVHFAGLPVDLTGLTGRPGVVVEDAAHAIGARTPDGPVGNCARSDMCCFSFHPVKTVTTGEGGAVTTNSSAYADALRQFRHHGIAKNPQDPFWKYELSMLGYNYRLTDIQAALGTSQLAKLDRFIAARAQIAERYREALGSKAGIELPPEASEGFRHGHHLFPIRVDDRDRAFDDLRSAGIGVQVHYVPTHRFAGFEHALGSTELPHTDAAADRLISLPIFPTLSAADQSYVIETLQRLL